MPKGILSRLSMGQITKRARIDVRKPFIAETVDVGGVERMIK
jgi:hypothetical protein